LAAVQFARQGQGALDVARAALARGLRVTFSDYDATALRFAADNAALNDCDNFETLQMDWRYPPTDRQFPMILAADLICGEIHDHRRRIPGWAASTRPPPTRCSARSAHNRNCS
jgi:hypothetical protein